MVGIEIGFDEVVLVENKGVRWTSRLSNINQYMETLFLSNKRIFGLYQKNNGVFKKATEEMIEIPLADIKMLNGYPMVKRSWNIDSFTWILEIQTLQGIHTFMFSENTKKVTAMWEEEIYKVFGKMPPKEKVPETSLGTFAGIAASIKGMANSAFNSVSDFATTTQEKQEEYKQSTEFKEREYFQSTECQTSGELFREIPPIPKKQVARNNFCMNCGTKLSEGAKFCHSCGVSIDNVGHHQNEKNSRTATGNYTSRVQEYAGTVLKCPNCGNVVSSLDAVCTACGMHLTGKMASSTVQKLSDTLLKIEREGTVEHKGGLFGQIGYEERVQNARRDAFQKKLTLIKTFPIPNTVDEIYEFMLLATANINVKISKNTVWSKFENSGSSEKELSDAWVVKMRQAYQKAEIAFPNDVAFKHIQKIYFDKMTELKMEV